MVDRSLKKSRFCFVSQVIRHAGGPEASSSTSVAEDNACTKGSNPAAGSTSTASAAGVGASGDSGGGAAGGDGGDDGKKGPEYVSSHSIDEGTQGISFHNLVADSRVFNFKDLGLLCFLGLTILENFLFHNVRAQIYLQRREIFPFAYDVCLGAELNINP